MDEKPRLACARRGGDGEARRAAEGADGSAEEKRRGRPAADGGGGRRRRLRRGRREWEMRREDKWRRTAEAMAGTDEEAGVGRARV